MRQMMGLSDDPPRRSGAEWALHTGWGLLLMVASWPLRVYRARQMMHALGRLADHELRDIGLTRLDLQDASALPLDADPSYALRRRAEERRWRR